MHQRTYTREKLFDFKVCKQPFSTSGSSIRHQKVHTEGKPFACLFQVSSRTQVYLLCRCFILRQVFFEEEDVFVNIYPGLEEELKRNKEKN